MGMSAAIANGMSTYETSLPWIAYHYGLTHDKWWPLWNSTRVLGVSKIVMQCAVCGDCEVVRIKIPRFGPVPVPESGRHPIRERFLRDHAHPDRGAPMSWALPLLNPAAHRGGLNLDALAMRVEARPQRRRPRMTRRFLTTAPLLAVGMCAGPDKGETTDA